MLSQPVSSSLCAYEIMHYEAHTELGGWMYNYILCTLEYVEEKISVELPIDQKLLLLQFTWDGSEMLC